MIRCAFVWHYCESVASLGLVSPGAATDGVTLFTSKVMSDDLFSVILLKTTVTSRTLSAFLGDRLSSSVQ